MTLTFGLLSRQVLSVWFFMTTILISSPSLNTVRPSGRQ